MIAIQLNRSSNEDKSHHAGSKFVNPWPSYIDVVNSPLAPFKILTKIDWREMWSMNDTPDPPVRLAIAPPSQERIQANWLGHASVLIEFPTTDSAKRGLRILCDPVWSHRCSPYTWLGPQRFTSCPVTQDTPLPEVDVVCISHNHYDHMDVPTLKQIYETQAPGSVKFLVPLKSSKPLIKEAGIDKDDIVEMDWWDSADVAVKDKTGVSTTSLRVHCTPNQHTSARGVLDKSSALWSSWAFVQGNKKVYFSGDTGYRSVTSEYIGKEDSIPWPVCPAFKEIGDRLGPFDLAFLPIGAHSPRQVMSGVHCDPKDAVSIHNDIKSRKSIAIHHMTWRLTDEPINQPREELLRLVSASKTPIDFTAVPIGSQIQA